MRQRLRPFEACWRLYCVALLLQTQAITSAPWQLTLLVGRHPTIPAQLPDRLAPFPVSKERHSRVFVLRSLLVLHD